MDWQWRQNGPALGGDKPTERCPNFYQCHTPALYLVSPLCLQAFVLKSPRLAPVPLCIVVLCYHRTGERTPSAFCMWLVWVLHHRTGERTFSAFCMWSICLYLICAA